MQFSDMFVEQLHSNFLLGICVGICVVSVLCIDENGIHENSLHSYDQSLTNDALLMYVCEHNKQRVECEENSVIHLLKASYGRTSLTTCDQNHDKKWSVKCVNNNKTEAIVRNKCNGKLKCDVSASNSVFGDPCAGTIKYLEVRYLCAPENKPISIHVCEHSNLHMECDRGKGIHILEANYGRTTLAKCTSYNLNWNQNCVSDKSEEILREKCDRKRACDVEAYNSIFGDPCPGTIKYIEMQYYCALDTPPPIHACEDGKLHIECYKGSVIQLLQANYGRTSLAKCDKDHNQWNVKCVNNKTEEIVKKICDGKLSCDLTATNSVFGDPCIGTIKYLEMQYTCVPDEAATTNVNTESITSERTRYQTNETIYACEDSNLHLECEEGNGIRTLQANYGRTSLAKCDEKRTESWSVTCVNNKTEAIVRKGCNGKRSCDVAATNSVFGDPCYGIIKYLEVQYLCAPDEVARTISNTERVTTERTSFKKNETNSIYACEDNHLHLECEKGNGLRTLQANYGRTSLTKCDEKRAKSWSVNCVNNKTEEIVGKVCNGKRSCNVAATNFVFGDPCIGTIKYLEMQYMCVPDGASTTITYSEWDTPEGTTPETDELISIHVCEDDNLHVECGKGKVIRLLKANYGRTTLAKCNQKYYKEWSVDCVTYSTGEIVRRKCDGKRSCDVAASNYVFGDPCYGTIKYLEVQYLCAPGNKAISVHVCENDNIHGECESGSVIHLLQANYGRTSLDMCNTYNNINWNVNCISVKSEDIIRDKCNGKRSCDVAATNSVFGDPCYGTIKYLEMQYLCVSAISEETEVPYSTTSLTNTIGQATTKSFKSVSPSTQNIPTIVPDITNTESNIRRTVSTVSRTVPDYPRTVSTVPRTVADYPRTVSTIPRTVSDYPSSVSAIHITFSDYPRTVSENPRTVSEYSTTVSEYPRADSGITKTLYDIATETIKYATTIISEETNASTIEFSTSRTTECGSYDLKCFKFECPDDFGSYLHPTSRRMFIICINWKPTIKTCGQGQVLSEKFMKCVSENHWWSRWGSTRGLQPQFRK